MRAYGPGAMHQHQHRNQHLSLRLLPVALWGKGIFVGIVSPTYTICRAAQAITKSRRETLSTLRPRRKRKPRDIVALKDNI